MTSLVPLTLDGTNVAPLLWRGHSDLVSAEYDAVIKVKNKQQWAIVYYFQQSQLLECCTCSDSTLGAKVSELLLPNQDTCGIHLKEKWFNLSASVEKAVEIHSYPAPSLRPAVPTPPVNENIYVNLNREEQWAKFSGGVNR